MAGLLTASYVHHTPWGDWDFAQFRGGMEYVDSLFAGRSTGSCTWSTTEAW